MPRYFNSEKSVLREVTIDSAKILAESLGHTLSQVTKWAGPEWYRGRCIYCLTKFDIVYENGKWEVHSNGQSCNWDQRATQGS